MKLTDTDLSLFVKISSFLLSSFDVDLCHLGKALRVHLWSNTTTNDTFTETLTESKRVSVLYVASD